MTIMQELTWADHANKHIREALDYAESKGWTVRKSGPRAHAWESSAVVTGIVCAACPSGLRRAIRRIMSGQFVAKWIVVPAHEGTQGEGT